VAIYGIDARFAELHGTGLPELTGTSIFPPVILNEPLQRELGVQPGEDVLLSFERPGEIPSETLLGEREADDVLTTRRFTVARVLPERGLGSFGLAAHQSQPRTAFVPLKDLQLAAERAGEINALVVGGPHPPAPSPASPTPSPGEGETDNYAGGRGRPSPGEGGGEAGEGTGVRVRVTATARYL
jgi:hypothetical protein